MSDSEAKIMAGPFGNHEQKLYEFSINNSKKINSFSLQTIQSYNVNCFAS